VADAFQVRGPEGEGRVLRLLHPVHVVDARAIARCLDEARALLYPPHPSIVPVEDAGQLPDGRVYLVGEDSELPLHLEQRSGLRPDDLVCIAEQLAPALDALHARGLLHGHLEADSVVGDPPRLSGVGFGVFQGGTTQEWTGGRDPGRRVDQGLLGRLLLALAGQGPEWTSVRAILERCTSVDDALPFPSVTVLARALRGACESDPLAETRHVPGPPPSVEVRARESTPATVGPYRVLGLLGEGAMGRVFRAERDGRPVALKLLRREHLRSRLLLDRFFREARAVSRIRHPHIVEVLEVGEERGAEGLERAYCVMELLEGKTLGALFRERSLDVARTVEIASQVCEALEAAHATGVVHRDVKPDNVFVVFRRGRLGEAARLRHRQLLRVGPEMSRTPATVIGTPHYMAPEQASGAAGGRAHRPLRARGGALRAARRPSPWTGARAPEPLPADTPAGEPIPRPSFAPSWTASRRTGRPPQSAAALRAALRAAVAGLLQIFLDQRQHFVQVEGFDVAHDAGQLGGALHRLAGADEQHPVAGAIVASRQLLEEGEAAHHRHHEVQEHQRRRLHLRQRRQPSAPLVAVTTA
jgi:serine/threonine protein kinase